ncbi:MAG TPA: hypothetical protein VKT70_04880 [Stellaceae bacterium]|nr:hypothetical protein [Stellaceae bacterium]
MRARGCVLILAGLLGACGMVDQDPSRDVFGVSASRPASQPNDAKLHQYLEGRVLQICTHDYHLEKEEVEQGENQQVLVDWLVRCEPYHLTVF